MSTALRVMPTEAQFQRTVTDLATTLGWKWLHVERMGNRMGQWRTPATGPLGKGWPDLILVRGREMIAIELKAEGKYLTPAQKDMAVILQDVMPFYVFRPGDWIQIVKALT